MLTYLCADLYEMAPKKLISNPATYSDVHLIGINTGLQDYKLAYFINKSTNLKLERLDNLPVFNEKYKSIRNYCLYSYFDADRRMDYYLFGNSHPNGKMIEHYAQADFFLLLKGQQNESINKNLIISLRQITSITFPFVTVLSKIKEFDGILHDLELHILNIKNQTPKKQTLVLRHELTPRLVYNA